MPIGDQEFVYSWKIIIANIKTEQKDGKHDAESGGFCKYLGYVL
jgi:hypothetical protein